MGRHWDEFASRIESGEPNRVNGALDDIGAAGVETRVASFEDCFNGASTLYETSEDGYVRQSCVRFVNELAPGLPAAVNLHSGDLETTTESELRDQTNALCGFYLEALTDEDGRVRQSATRGLKAVFRTYDELGDRDTAEAVLAELDDMAADRSGTVRNHLLEAREDAEVMLERGIGRLVRDARRELDE